MGGLASERELRDSRQVRRQNVPGREDIEGRHGRTERLGFLGKHGGRVFLKYVRALFSF